MQTLLLDVQRWDLVLDANGNIAVASDPYSVAQDVASACRTFLGEVYYETTQGVPYGQILGLTPPASFLKAQLESAALTVPGVTNPQAFITDPTDRVVMGQVQFEDANGQTQVAAF